MISVSACRTTRPGFGSSDLASSKGETQAQTDFSGRLYYNYTLKALHTKIEFSPDYDSKLVLSAEIGADVEQPQVKMYKNGSTGYGQTITFDLVSGVIRRVDEQVGIKQKPELSPPAEKPETQVAYVEYLEELLDQVSIIREGRNRKNAQHLELNSLVDYLEKVLAEVRSAIKANAKSQAEEVSKTKEITFEDAEELMASFERLGIITEPNEQGFPSQRLEGLKCSLARNEDAAQCTLENSERSLSAGEESESIYRVLTKNKLVSENSDRSAQINFQSVECVQYRAYGYTAICSFEL